MAYNLPKVSRTRELPIVIFHVVPCRSASFVRSSKGFRFEYSCSEIESNSRETDFYYQTTSRDVDVMEAI
jgi:hypothetical protein